MKPIYEPKGKAKEYGDYAINIYTGCPHRCYYCFAPSVLRRDRETFHANVQPREGIVEAVKKQLEREKITGKLIHLCFTCDPYPTGYDTTPTREIIKLLKEHGNHMCNHYKRAHSLDTFRRYIEEIPRKLRDDYIYKVGIVYGNVIENEKPIKFYFEEAEGKGSPQKRF